MRTLVLITSQFPFGKGEAFIESELPFLSAAFDNIIIIAQDVTGDKTRHVPPGTTVLRYNTATSLKGFFYLPVILILNTQKIAGIIRNEVLFRLKTEKRFRFTRFLILLRMTLKSLQLSGFIRKNLKTLGITENIVLYSYWFKTGAHAISLLEYPKSIRIARAHGSDVYEENTVSGYLPLLNFTAENLDAVFFISKNGRQYLSQKIKKSLAAFMVSRLGIDNPGSGLTGKSGSQIFLIVSCSNMIPLKRIDRIIESLALTETTRIIQWLHFGDGILKDELREMAQRKLGNLPGISYRFMGHRSNKEIIDFYNKNRIDLFINTSSTEGVPVSIMEAQSAGIPVIATNVGGVSEIVVEGTGSLLSPDFEIGELAGLIDYYAGLNEKEMNVIRENSVNNWNSFYKASVNYEEFIKNINSIFATATTNK